MATAITRGTALCVLILTLCCPREADAQRRSSRSRAPESWFSIRAGQWFLDSDQERQPVPTDMSGVEASFRLGQTDLLALSITLAAWRGEYQSSRLQLAGSGEAYEVYEYDAWDLVMPMEIGLTFTTPAGRRAQAAASIGGGLIATVTKAEETRTDVPSDPASTTRTIFSPSVLVCVDGAVNLSRAFGVVAALTYRYAPLTQTLATWHTTLTGASLSAGIRVQL